MAALQGLAEMLERRGDWAQLRDIFEARAAAGISDGLLRLSVGIEHVDDLVADIQAALQRAQDAAGCPRKVAR